MLLNAPTVEHLIEAFRRLPGVGKKTAERYALHLLSAPPELAEDFALAVKTARDRVVLCSQCRNLAETDPCPVCVDPRRDHGLLCVVEQPVGAMAIEKGGAYRGVYHVLHGVLSPLENVGPEELCIDRLLRRLENGVIREVIIATNATAEGEATALYLSRMMTAKGVRVTRIAHGVPMGGGLEYADDATLAHALHGRKPL